MRSFAPLILALPMIAQTPQFSQPEAMWAEWRRQAPLFSERQMENMPAEDRARWELSLRRIQGIGAPPLLPPELDHPTQEAWLDKAALAKEPRERFDALYFLNRSRSGRAISALADMAAEDMTTWPRHLRLEAQLTAALLNCLESNSSAGQGNSNEIETIKSFWDSMGKAVPADPLRQMVSWLRLSMSGYAHGLDKPALIEAAPHAILALMDVWNRIPWDRRKALLPEGQLNLGPDSPFWASIGLKPPSDDVLARAHAGIMSRLSEGVPNPAPQDWMDRVGAPWILDSDPLAQWYGFQSLARYPSLSPEDLKALDRLAKDKKQAPLMQASLLPALYKHLPKLADRRRDALLAGQDPVARSLAVQRLTSAPKDRDLDRLIKRLWHANEYDGVQNLIRAFGRWELPPEKHKELLGRFLEHPSWTARLDAWRELQKLDPETPWPKAPSPALIDENILALGRRLMQNRAPVRIQVEFRDHGHVIMNLDPANAPMNVANLVILVRRGFFDGRRVPRIVPDFVVQMGSPYDTMNGGPGHNVRCENSLDWYGPGSIGMALSGMDTGGSQFFFTLNATPHLTGRYTRVGVLEDLDSAMKVLESLELGAVIERARVIEGAD